MEKTDTAWIVYQYTEGTFSVVQVQIRQWFRNRTVFALMPPLFGSDPVPVRLHCDQLFYSQALAEEWALENARISS